MITYISSQVRVLAPRSSIANSTSLVLFLWILSLSSLVPGPRTEVPIPGLHVSGYWFRYIQELLESMIRNYYKEWEVWQSVTVITKCNRKLLQSVTGVTKCDRKLLQKVTGITERDKKLLQSVTAITKCDNYCKVRRSATRGKALEKHQIYLSG